NSAGTKTISVSLVVSEAPPPPPPLISVDKVLNAASFAAVAVVPGSYSTLMGHGFSGRSVAATFDGIAGTISYNNGNQMNLIVPTDIANRASSQLVVTVDGVSSAPVTVPVAAFQPGIFGTAPLNSTGTLNSASNPAEPNSVVVVFATGLSGQGTI